MKKVVRMWNGAETYWIKEGSMFGKPVYEVREGYWWKPVVRYVDRGKAEACRDRRNAYVYLISRIDDRRYLIELADKVGLGGEDFEGFSNASVIGEIAGSDEYGNVIKELAGGIT